MDGAASSQDEATRRMIQQWLGAADDDNKSSVDTIRRWFEAKETQAQERDT